MDQFIRDSWVLGVLLVVLIVAGLLLTDIYLSSGTTRHDSDSPSGSRISQVHLFWAMTLLLPALIIYLLYFDSSPLAKVLARPRKSQSLLQDKVQVWVQTNSGFYYCSGTKPFGNWKPGRIMNQGEALQEGYRPYFQELCPAPPEKHDAPKSTTRINKRGLR